MELTVESLRGMELSQDDSDPGAGRPVDLVHLARFTLGNRSLEREVLELFSRQSEIYMQKLKNASSPKAWAEAVHTIKGSARGIGAWGVARTAEAVEKLQGEELEQQRSSALEALEERIGEANGYIESLLKE